MINSVYNTARVILNKDSYGELTGQRFGYLAKDAQLKLLSAELEQQRRSLAKPRNKKVEEIERALDLLYTPNTVIQRAESGGNILDYFELPDDLWLEDVYTFNDTTPITFVDKSKFYVYKRSALTQPSINEPIAMRYGSKMEVIPSTIGVAGTFRTSSVKINYYKYPSDPSLAYVSGTTILDPSEPNDFILPLSYHDKLVVEICRMEGTELREPQVVEYANIAKQETIRNENA